MTRTLVIDTATAACSVALIEDGRVLASGRAIVGRGHAERLVPMIADLPDGGRAARILVDVGPGSFTGVRVGIAAARGLGFGWGAPVAGYSGLTLIAAAAFARRASDRPPDRASDQGPRDRLAVVLEGGHGEVFMQMFAPGPDPLTPLASLRPDAAIAAIGGAAVIGSGVARLIALDPDLDAEDALPDAADAVLLPADMLPATPLYGRAPDAKPPGGVTPPAAGQG